MDPEKLSSGTCPIARGLALVGDAWSALILREVGRGQTQFDQLRSNLGIAPNILSRRLKALTDVGVLEKRRYNERPPRDEYVMTQAGREFLPILAAIGEWGRRHNGRGAPLSYLVNEDTGERANAIVVDEATGAPFGEVRTRIVLPEGVA